MMDQKTWLWKRSSAIKTITASDNEKLSLEGNRKQRTLLHDEAELQRELATLNKKLSSALSDCNKKDNFMKQQTEMAQEAIAGREKAEAEAKSVEQELEKAIKQRIASEERSISMDVSLKECMQQLRFVREEQEKRIYDAIMKTSREYEEMIIVLEERLAETSRRVTVLGAQNAHLSKALLEKEKVIKELQEHRTRSDAYFSTLMTKLEYTEKENVSLKYEVHVVDRELDIRNEQMEFNRRTAEVTHKQHLETVKKIAKLESECQRLRLLVRKRLPGPAALAKMKFGMEMLATDPAESRSRNSTSSMDLAVNAPDTPTKRINFLAKQLNTMKEENKTLTEALIVKDNDLRFSESICGSTTYRFSEFEAELDESSRSATAMKLRETLPNMHEVSQASISDMDTDGSLLCSESMDSDFISKLEHLRNKKDVTTSTTAVGTSDINLMDDFAEMEKLAFFSSDESARSSHLASEGGKTTCGPLEAQSGGYISEATGADFMPVDDHFLDPTVFKHSIQSEKTSNCRSPVWVKDIAKVVLEQSHATQRSPDDILEVIKVAMAHINPPEPSESVDKNLSCGEAEGCISVKPAESFVIIDSPDRLIVDNMFLAQKNDKHFDSDLGKSVRKIIELVEGISLSSLYHGPSEIMNVDAHCSKPSTLSETSTGYVVRVFQWKTSDLSVVLQKFVRICNDILNGNTDIKNFIEELTSSLEWIMNHCFSLQDVSIMKDAIKEHFDWDDSQSESEIIGGTINQFPEADKSHSSIISDWKCHNNLLQMKEHWSNVIEESGTLRDELANTKHVKESMGRFKSEFTTMESMMKIIENLQGDLEIISQSKRNIEDQFHSTKLLTVDLDTQLAAARVELNEGYEKLSFLEDELDQKNMFCEELESTCLDLQLQLESMTKKETPKYDLNLEERQLQNDLEIATASEKLAECQETILTLGRQLQAMASPRNACPSNKVIFTSTYAMTTISNPKDNNKQRTSLLDKMLAEDSAGNVYPRSPITKEIICTLNSPTVVDDTSDSAFGLKCTTDPPEMYRRSDGNKQQDEEALVNSFVVIPGKKHGSGGLWKNLMWRLRKAKVKKGLPI